MDYQKQQQYLSQDRLNKYKVVLGGDTRNVHRLYKANIRLAQSFYPLLTILEVALRNSIDQCLIGHLNDNNWIRNQVHGFMSDQSLGRGRNQFTMRKMAQKTLINNQNASHGKLISDINFGFWTEFFDRTHYALVNGSVISAFF